MNKLISSKVLLGISSLIVMLVLSSCISSNDPDSRVLVFLQLKGTTKQAGRADTVLVAGNDSLTISNVRLITGKSQLVRGTTPLPLPILMLRFSSTSTTSDPAGNAELIARGHRGIAGTYQALDFKIIQAADSLRDNGRNIDDIFYDGGHYSIIIQGTYNDSDFTFKSKQNFESMLALQPPIDVPQKSAVAKFIVSAKVRNWFLNGSGQGFLDPSDKSNTSAINQNIQQSFKIRVQSNGTSSTM